MSEKKSITPIIYAALMADLPTLCREYGYAVAIHGSMMRDFDLIAVPWVDDHKSAEELIAAIARALEPYDGGPVSGPTSKPGGRRAWLIPICCGYAVDISVTPWHAS